MSPLVRTARFVLALAAIAAVGAGSIAPSGPALVGSAGGTSVVEAPCHDEGSLPLPASSVAESEEEQEDERVRQRLLVAGSPDGQLPRLERPREVAPRATRRALRSARPLAPSHARAPPLG